MTHDLKLYALAICLPAIVLTIVGLAFLQRQSVSAQVRERQARVAFARQLQADVREALDESSAATAERQKALFAVGADEVQPQGVFAWATHDGLVWTNGVPSTVASVLDERRYLKDWTDGSRAAAKRPPRHGLFTLTNVAATVVWARSTTKGDERIYGAVFAGDPTDRGGGVPFWPIACALVLLFAGVLGAGTLLLWRAAAKARRDDARKTTFVSNASHELKTPLAAINLWAEILTMKRATEQQREHAAHVILEENGRMIRLVENLLDFARLEEGRRRYVISEVDVGALAAETADLVRGDFAAHGLTVTTDTDCLALTDGDAVKQILVNLLGNAAKYAAEGGPVEVAVAKSETRVRVEVRDRGPGMTPAQMRRVFERFYQVNDSLAGKKSGLGLGLSIAQALARDLEGSLTVASREGGGTVFALELPGSVPEAHSAVTVG